MGLRRWRVLSSLELHKAAATVIPIAQTIVRYVSRKKKEFQESELVALDWKKWTRSDSIVKMFWLFFAAAGLAVAVAVDVGGINMNTGVNTGDFL